MTIFSNGNDIFYLIYKDKITQKYTKIFLFQWIRAESTCQI